MGAWLDLLAPPLLDALVGAAAWLGLIALAMVANRQPARRCALARAGIVGAIGLLPLAFLGVIPRIDVLRAVRAFTSRPIAWELPHCGRLPALLIILYLIGALAGLTWLTLGWWGWGRIARHSVEPSRGTRELFEGLTAGLPRGRRPRLRVTHRLRRPGLVRVLRPLIVIPPELDRPEARDRLRLALLHELAHAERHDPCFGLLGALAQAFWFPLPQLWWIRAQMRLDHEFLADRSAAGGFGAPGRYASSLVELAAPPNAAGRADVSNSRDASGAGGSPLVRRVMMLLGCPFEVDREAPNWWRWALPPATVIGVILASGLTLRGAAPHPVRGAGPRTFRLARVSLVEPSPGRASPTITDLLAFPLPPRFDLTLEVWANDEVALSQVRIAGHPLVNPDGPPLKMSPSWHSVELSREEGRVFLRVDDRAILDHVPDLFITPTLSVTPPQSGPGEFRNIKLSW